MIRFRFALTPLDEVEPWGRNAPHLGWFILSHGYYWIELNGHELLRYSEETIERDRAEGYAVPSPYVDYQVSRLWEDVIEVTPRLMEPVPDDLNEHCLDLAYLRDPQSIWAWRTITGDADLVTVAWMYDESDGDDIRYAAPASGRVTMPTEAFLDAVRRFDREFLDAMGQRVAELERVGPPPGVHLDPRHLRVEQEQRSSWLAEALLRAPETDWPAVRAGMRELRAD